MVWIHRTCDLFKDRGQMFLKLYKKCGILLIEEQMFGAKFFCRFNLIIY